MPAPSVRSKDSVQQRLRDHKRQWNASYKDLSQRLKALKDGLNGRGNAKVGLPPSNIKEPMPTEIGSYLSQIAGEFQTIVGDAESIIAEQAQYAQTRRRKKPKAPAVSLQAPQENSAAPPTTPQAPPAVEENLARLGAAEHGLEKQGSNKLSRFWQYLTGIFSMKEFNRQRVGLLSQAADLYYSLIDLENNVLSMGVDSIPNTVASYKKFKYNYSSFVGTFNGVRAAMEQKAEQAGVQKPEEVQEETIEPESEEIEETVKPKPTPEPAGIIAPLAKIKSDLHLLFNANLGKQQVQDLFDMLKEYEEETDDRMKAMWADRVKSNYEELVKHLANEAQKRFGPANVRSIQDIINLVKQNKKATYISDNLIKTSHNALTRAMKRRLVKMRTSNKTAPVRLQLDDIISNMKTTIKSIMDNLEKDLSVEELVIFIESLNEDSDRLKQPLHVLNTFFMKDFFTKKEKQKSQPGRNGFTGDEEMMDYVLQRKLKRELSEDLT